MNNAVWLLFALPTWYFSAILSPLSAGPLTVIPALGTIFLAVGSIYGLVRRDQKLILFLIPAAISELFVAIAGALRGQMFGNFAAVVLIFFIIVQVVLVGYLTYYLKESRLAAIALA